VSFSGQLLLTVDEKYSIRHALLFASMAIAYEMKILKLFSEDDEIQHTE
jgi:hypothetical protein